MGKFLLLFSRFVLIDLVLLSDFYKERRVLPLATVAIPCMPFTKRSSFHPSKMRSDSLMPDEIGICLCDVVERSFGAREAMAIEFATAHGTCKHIALRQPTSMFDRPESVTSGESLFVLGVQSNAHSPGSYVYPWAWLGRWKVEPLRLLFKFYL
jgi:hypothetical protein